VVFTFRVRCGASGGRCDVVDMNGGDADGSGNGSVVGLSGNEVRCCEVRFGLRFGSDFGRREVEIGIGKC
jgi:hypothetical protein